MENNSNDSNKHLGKLIENSSISKKEFNFLTSNYKNMEYKKMKFEN